MEKGSRNLIESDYVLLGKSTTPKVQDDDRSPGSSGGVCLGLDCGSPCFLRLALLLKGKQCTTHCFVQCQPIGKAIAGGCMHGHAVLMGGSTVASHAATSGLR